MIIKNLMLVILLTTTIAFSQNGEKKFINQPYIEVTGQIETEITPNEIYLNIEINENDKRGRISIEQQENQLISTLKSLQIDLDKNFSILDYNGYYKKKFLADDKVTKKKRYQLIVSNTEMLGKVYQTLDEIDISNIFIYKTSHSDIEEIRRETKLNALKMAKKKANDYAMAIDQTIGKALLIKEISNNSNNRIYTNSNEVLVTALGIDRSRNFQDLNIKSITLTATVLAKFSLN